MKKNKVIISEKLLDRQTDYNLNNTCILLDQNFGTNKNNMYKKYQNFNLDNSHVLKLKRIK